MILLQLHDKSTLGEPIRIDNFVIDTIPSLLVCLAIKLICSIYEGLFPSILKMHGQLRHKEAEIKNQK